MDNQTYNDTGGYSKRYWQEKESNNDLLLRYMEHSQDIKTVKPDCYDRRSLHNFKEYVQQCELTFYLRLDWYSRDSTRVLYTAQFLVKEIARVFK